jgi:hypothetical protein
MLNGLEMSQNIYLKASLIRESGLAKLKQSLEFFENLVDEHSNAFRHFFQEIATQNYLSQIAIETNKNRI